MITVVIAGSYKDLEAYLTRLSKLDIASILNASGQAGVNALAQATPVSTGLAAESWSYEVTHDSGTYTIAWTNSDIENSFPVVIMLQYGHGTGTGGWVAGKDFINPAIQPIFDRIANDVWKAVTAA